MYWNEELKIPQTCTGCAHLLDDGWTVPRCVDACPTHALTFGEEDELDLEGAEQLAEGSHVWYLNLPKRFVTGCIVDFDAREVVIGTPVQLLDSSKEVVAEQVTDEFGDFMFDQVKADAYTVRYETLDGAWEERAADASEADVNLGDVSAA